MLLENLRNASSSLTGPIKVVDTFVRRKESRSRNACSFCTDELPDEVKKAVDGSGATVIEYEVNLTYDNFKADEVLRTLLPDGVEAPRSFECVGHIAHVNLKEEQEPYKNLIGQVLLDKNRPTIRTVVNKVLSWLFLLLYTYAVSSEKENQFYFNFCGLSLAFPGASN